MVVWFKRRDGNKFLFVWIYWQEKKKGRRFFRAYYDQDSVIFFLFPLISSQIGRKSIVLKSKKIISPSFSLTSFFFCIPNSCSYSKISFVVYLSGIFIYSQNTSLLKKLKKKQMFYLAYIWIFKKKKNICYIWWTELSLL